MATGEKKLAVAIAAIFPFTLASRRIEAGQNFFVQSVDVTIPKDRVRKFVFQKLIPPEFVAAEALGALDNLDCRAACSIAGGEEETICAEHHRLRNHVVIL